MNISLRSPLLWISATILSALLYFFAFHFFPKTFPLIHLDITMDLHQAVEQAQTIAQKNNLGPIDHRHAAMFHTDGTVKTFVELEAGGKDAFVAMMEEKLYMPYTWRVRHFKEYEKNEATIIFTPNGTPYGFIEVISENLPGEQLAEGDARRIAETTAATDWNIDFNTYTLVETSQKTEPSKRIDHTFVYELTDKKIGEGLYRLTIVVSGDKVTQLHHHVKVPESFHRHYAEMRSANGTISWAATLVMWMLYIIIGCGFGLYWIISTRCGLFKQPLCWAIFLALAAVLTSVNQLPFSWMHYNNAQSPHGFLIQLFLGLFISLIAQTTFLAIVITVAESLTRRAFGHQPQLWSLWSSDNRTSYAVLGRTVAGYLCVSFMIAFVVAFYLLSTRYLGWWTPSDILFDPNILATYAPWFTPLAKSLNAGFSEECLFRAIPLAGAALLGNRFGKEIGGIGGAFILQAIIFGAAHAHYPTQPSYARLIELIIPSFIWGATYLQFGLLPNIIAHFVYDVIWFSLPIFVSHTPHAIAYKIIIVVITLFPLLFLLYARLRKGRWTELSDTSTNAAWQTSVTETKRPQPPIMPTQLQTLSNRAQKLMLGLGVLALIAWICTTPFTHDGITITINRTQAVQCAEQFLQQQHNTILHAPWRTLPLIFTNYLQIPHLAAQHKFIWREGSKELYHDLVGTYLHPAHWTVRYAQFDTDILARAEEYKIMLYNDTIWRYYHQLPENTAGTQLTQDEARTIAHTALAQQFNLNAADLTEISATSEQLPHRKNWLFIFSNPTVYPLPTGQARINISISGDTVTDAVRSIHVPEEWERNEQHVHSIIAIISLICTLIALFLLLCGAIIAFRQRRAFVFPQQLFFMLLGTFALLFVVDMINGWPTIVGVFNTSLPLNNQLFQTITSFIFSFILKAVLYAAACAYLLGQRRVNNLPNNWITISAGISIGLSVAGIFSIAHIIIPTQMPLWPHYDTLGYTVPLLAALISTIIHYAQTTITVSLLYLIIDSATQQWRTYRLLFIAASAVCCMMMIELPTLTALPLWITVGTAIGWILLALYRYIMRYDYALIPLATGSFAILQIIQQGMFNAYPGAVLEAVVTACTVALLSASWYWYMNRTEIQQQ